MIGRISSVENIFNSDDVASLNRALTGTEVTSRVSLGGDQNVGASRWQVDRRGEFHCDVGWDVQLMLGRELDSDVGEKLDTRLVRCN